MKTSRKAFFVIGAAVFLITIAGTAAAIEDSTGDVWHYKQTGGNWQWEKYTGDKSNIDITDISYSIDGNEATLIMNVDGEIENSQSIFYYMHLVSDNGTYQAYYSNNVGMVIGSGNYSGFYDTLTNPVSGDTFTATFELYSSVENCEAWGYAAEYTSVAAMSSSEWWGDYAPNSYANWYTGEDTGNGGSNGDEDDDGGTPGFELIALIVAIGIALILFRKKK